MLRFLVTRILSALPILLVLSVVTFMIIQAPPGDYGDYIRSMLINQGGATPEQAEIQAEAYRAAHGLNDPLVRPACGRAVARAIRHSQLHLIAGMGHDLPRALWPRITQLLHENARRAG